MDILINILAVIGAINLLGIILGIILCIIAAINAPEVDENEQLKKK